MEYLLRIGKDESINEKQERRRGSSVTADPPLIRKSRALSHLLLTHKRKLVHKTHLGSLDPMTPDTTLPVCMPTRICTGWLERGMLICVCNWEQELSSALALQAFNVSPQAHKR